MKKILLTIIVLFLLYSVGECSDILGCQNSAGAGAYLNRFNRPEDDFNTGTESRTFMCRFKCNDLPDADNEVIYPMGINARAHQPGIHI